MSKLTKDMTLHDKRLFIIYINDMINATNKLFPLIFADDTNVFITGKNIENLINEMNSEMTKLVEWLHVNKLSINVKKTHYMIFNKCTLI